MNARSHTSRWRLGLAFGASVLAHLLLLAVFRPPADETFVVTTILEEPEPEEAAAAELADEPDPLEPPEVEQALVQPVDAQIAAPAQVAPRENTVVAVAELPEERPPEQEPEPEQEAAAAPVPTPPAPTPEAMPSVAQPDRETEAPDQAEFLAEVDNSTDVQTMAEDTVLAGEPDDPTQAALEEPPPEAEEPEPGAPDEVFSENTAEPTEAETALDSALAELPDQTSEPATALGDEAGEGEVNEAAGPDQQALDAIAAAPDVSEQPVEGESAVLEELPGPEAGETPPASPLAAFSPQMAVARSAQIARTGGSGAIAAGDRNGIDGAAYVEVFSDRDRSDGARVEREARSASLVGNHQERWDRTRAALENFDVHVTPGSETSLNTRADEVAGYIHYLHNKIHPMWWEYLTRLDMGFGPADALSDLSLTAVMEFGIDRDGEVASVNIVDGSGVLSFDAHAVDVLYEIGPHQPPPPGMLSSNGNAYIRWTMHRDNRGCGTFGASGHRVQMGAGEGG